jgi:hypothetical protein
MIHILQNIIFFAKICHSFDNNNVFRCHLCGKTRASSQMMIWHLGWGHFKDRISQRFALTKKNLECPGNRLLIFPSKYNLIEYYHIGNYVYNCLSSLPKASEAASTSNPPPGAEA